MRVYVRLFVTMSVRVCVCVCSLIVGAPLGAHGSVQGQRLVQGDRPLVEAGFADAAVEGGQASG